MTKELTAEELSAFLAAQEPERRDAIEAVRNVIRENLPAGYEEVATGKSLIYQVPLEKYPDTYNKKPLWYAGLVSEKSYLSLHLMPVYGNEQIREKLEAGFQAAGKKLNMGKACVRFTKAEDLAIDAIAEVVRSMPIDQWIAYAKSAWRR